MIKQTLYSLRRAATEYTITKFVDGEVESTYITNLTECECPAGHRPSCRHRQMLPMMLAHGIVDTHWFWDFDSNRVVDFSGELKSNLDALNELATHQPQAKGPAGASFGGWEPLRPQAVTEDVAPQQQKPSWRRL